MEISLKSFILYAAVVLTGLSAGLFYAWTVSVIPGTQKVVDGSYLQTMQSINKEILNPAFFLIFFGSIIFLAAATVTQYPVDKFTFGLMLAATIFYVGGTFGVTVLGNIPLNNELEALNVGEMTVEAMAEFRSYYESNWNRWHYVRTIFAVLAFMLSVVGVFSFDRH